MPKIDTAELLAAMEQERNEIDAAIKTLTRTLQRKFTPPSGTTRKRTQAVANVPAKAAKTRKRKPLSAAVKKRLAESTKKRWAAARKAGKTHL